jgi:hypothetical protein
VRLGVSVSPYSMAVISAGVGDREQTLEWLSNACEVRSPGLARLKTEARFNPMHSDPRFAEPAKRADSIALEQQDASEEIVLPQPLTGGSQRSTASVPAPAWKRLLWPDIVDAKSAREAAALAVWASAAIIAARWLLSFLVATPTVTGLGWWNDPIVLTVIFVAIGFGVQKMGRPAAVIGTVLCALGALFNLNALSPIRGAVEVFVLAFVSAWRGTFAYRAMVQARQTQDKQDALRPEDLLAIRRRIKGVLQRASGTRLLSSAKTATDRAAAGWPTAALPSPTGLTPSSAIRTRPGGRARRAHRPQAPRQRLGDRGSYPSFRQGYSRPALARAH